MNPASLRGAVSSRSTGFNFFLADLQTGMGPYVALFLASVRHFNPAAVGIATATGGFATVLMQTPAGAITDATTRRWLVVARAALVGAIVLVNATAFWLNVSVQISVGAAFAFLSVRRRSAQPGARRA